MTRFLSLIVILILLPLGINANWEYPLCSTPIYNIYGDVDVEATLYNCSSNVRGAMFPPSYFRASSSDEYGPTIVNMTVPINTLISLDDVNAQVTFDIYIRMVWKDPRFHLPQELWDSINPMNGQYEGLEISPYVRSQNSLSFWLPDVQIMEAVSFVVEAELIHLLPTGVVYWSRHIVVTLSEPQMDLHQYPNDLQYMKITLQSFSYSTDNVVLVPFTGKGFSSLNTVASQPTVKALTLNRLWTYSSNYGYEFNAASSIFFHKTRQFSTVCVVLGMSRKTFGIILRMVLPVVIFMMIVALTFWADIDKRIDITVQMLLVVSSLYFVIGQFIPFVGYFTIFDLFITCFFGILGATIAVHFFVYQLEIIKHKYPLAHWMSEFVVYTARIVAMPLCMALVMYFFPNPDTSFAIPLAIVLALAVGAGLGGTPLFLRTCYFTLCKLRYLRETREFKHAMKEHAPLLSALEEEEKKKAEQEKAALDQAHSHKDGTKDVDGSEVNKSHDLQSRSRSDSNLSLLALVQEEGCDAKKGVSYLAPALSVTANNLAKHNNETQADKMKQHRKMHKHDNHNHEVFSNNKSYRRRRRYAEQHGYSHSPYPPPPPQDHYGYNPSDSYYFNDRDHYYYRDEDELSDVDTIDTAVEHRRTRFHRVGKMKQDGDIEYDLLINATKSAVHRHELEQFVLSCFQHWDCCAYHRQVRLEMMKEIDEHKKATATTTTTTTPTAQDLEGNHLHHEASTNTQEETSSETIMEQQYWKFLCCTNTSSSKSSKATKLKAKHKWKRNYEASENSRAYVDIDAITAAKEKSQQNILREGNQITVKKNTSFMSLSSNSHNNIVVNDSNVDIESAVPGLMMMRTSPTTTSTSFRLGNHQQPIQWDESDDEDDGNESATYHTTYESVS